MTTSHSKRETSKTALAIGAGILLVSTASILIRFAQTEASSIVIAAARLLIASLVLVPIALTHHRNELGSLTRKDIARATLSGIFLALHFIFWITSLEFTSVASSVVLVTTTPLWVALVSPLVLKEKLPALVLLGLVISLVGSGVVGLADACTMDQARIVCKWPETGSSALVGNSLALLGAWMAAGYMIMGRQLRKKLSTITYSALVYGVAALILVVMVVLRSEPVTAYSPRTYLYLFALGILPQLLGHSLLNWALKYLSAALVSLTLLGEPIGTIILALILLRESPTLLEWVGATLILAGIIVGSLGRRTRLNAVVPDPPFPP